MQESPLKGLCLEQEYAVKERFNRVNPQTLGVNTTSSVMGVQWPTTLAHPLLDTLRWHADRPISALVFDFSESVFDRVTKYSLVHSSYAFLSPLEDLAF